jgi:hypothetical protein
LSPACTKRTAPLYSCVYVRLLAMMDFLLPLL